MSDCNISETLAACPLSRQLSEQEASSCQRMNLSRQASNQAEAGADVEEDER